VSTSADVVVIGGGAVGASTAYHLTRLGVADVVLLERDTLAAGSTGKSAGGIRAQFADELNVRIALRSLAEFLAFEELTGADIALRQPGYLFLLDDERDVATFRAALALQQRLGVPSRELTPDEAGALVPGLVTDDLLAATFCPIDGYATPEAVVQGYASAARARGALLRQGEEVAAIRVRGGRIEAVQTRREERLEDLAEHAARRLPLLAELPVQSSWSGLYEMSPDHNALVGEAADVSRFLYATGFSGHGFQQAPAVGEHLAELVTRRPPTLDLSPFAVERFTGGASRAERFVV
jgi:glycine/D-amino acid oxidase-like deaminating enzyme